MLAIKKTSNIPNKSHRSSRITINKERKIAINREHKTTTSKDHKTTINKKLNKIQNNRTNNRISIDQINQQINNDRIINGTINAISEKENKISNRNSLNRRFSFQRKLLMKDRYLLANQLKNQAENPRKLLKNLCYLGSWRQKTNSLTQKPLN